MQPLNTMSKRQQREQRTAILIVIGLMVLLLIGGFLLVQQHPSFSFLPGMQTALFIALPCVLIFLGVLCWYLLKHFRYLSTFGSAHFATRKDVRQMQQSHSPRKQRRTRTRNQQAHTGTRRKMTLRLIVAGIIIFYISNFIYQVFTNKDQIFPDMKNNPTLFYTEMTLMVAVFVFLAFLGGIIWFIIWLARSSARNRQPDTTHGSAHFADVRELPQVRSQSAQGAAEMILGIYQGEYITLSMQQQENHVLVVAPSGKGKTSSIIIPALLDEAGERTLVINDVKHELIDKVGGAVAQNHVTYVFSPTNPSESNAYNPLAHVTTMSDAQAIAKAIIRNTSGQSNERFWDDATELLLVASILHIKATEPDAPFSRLAELLTGNTLQDIATILTNSPSQTAKKTATSFMLNVQANQKLAGSIMVDVSTRMFHMMDEHVEQVTAHDELDFFLLGNEPSALFLHIPPHEAERLKWLTGCLLMQLINHLTRQRHRMHVAFYLDELANAGHIPGYTEYISYVRSAGIAFLQIIQDFGQLERIYERHGKDTILANSSTKMFLSGCGQVEAEFCSRVMGSTTVQTSTEEPAMFGLYNAVRSYGQASRPLMYPDEIRTLPPGMAVVIMDNLPPIVLHMQPYFTEPAYKPFIGLPFRRYRPRTVQPAAKLPTRPQPQPQMPRQQHAATTPKSGPQPPPQPKAKTPTDDLLMP